LLSKIDGGTIPQIVWMTPNVNRRHSLKARCASISYR
jgi:hypothetical protein